MTALCGDGRISGEVFSSIEEAVEDIRNGKMVIVVDDDCRENEGDLIIAASLVTTDAVNFMVRHARGLVCVPLGRRSSGGFGWSPWSGKERTSTAPPFS